MDLVRAGESNNNDEDIGNIETIQVLYNESIIFFSRYQKRLFLQCCFFFPVLLEVKLYSNFYTNHKIMHIVSDTIWDIRTHNVATESVSSLYAFNRFFFFLRNAVYVFWVECNRHFGDS